MKRTVGIACALALSFALVACGGKTETPGSADTGTDATVETTETTESTEATGTSEAKDPKEQFVGTWKLAGIERQGMIIVGDVSSMLSDGQGEALFVVNADGTATLAFGEETSDGLTWILNDDGVMSVIPNNPDQSIGTMTVSYDKGALIMNVENGEESGKIYFSQDGTLADMPTIDTATATAITDASKIQGTWKLSAITYQGMTAYGDMAAFTEMIGMTLEGGGVMTITFADDGTATLGPTTGTWEATADGVTFTEDKTSENSISLTADVKALGSDLVLQTSGELESLGVAFVFSR